MLHLIILYITIVSAEAQGETGNFVLPSAFEGLWSGVPSASILGPWTDKYVFSISKASNGDYLFENNFLWPKGSPRGWQRFYIEGSGDTAGSLWYCGLLRSYGQGDMAAGYDRLDLFKATNSSDENTNSIKFCHNEDDPRATQGPFPPGCFGCDCASWTLSLSNNNTLTSSVVMAGYATHMQVDLQRVGPAPPISIRMPGHGPNFNCDFTPGGRDAIPVPRNDTSSTSSGKSLIPNFNLTQHLASYPSPSTLGCPFFQGTPDLDQVVEDTAKVLEEHVLVKEPEDFHDEDMDHLTSPKVGDYDNCYVINRQVDYRLEWSLDDSLKTISVRISAPVTSDQNGEPYIAIGFRPFSQMPNNYSSLGTGQEYEFTMSGADIVAGSVSMGVKTMYAQDVFGPPSQQGFLSLTNQAVGQVDGRLYVSFTRKFIDGFLLQKHQIFAPIVDNPAADILWAVGNTNNVNNNNNNNNFHDHNNRNNNNNVAGLGYHGVNRGMRISDWRNPEKIFSGRECLSFSS